MGIDLSKEYGNRIFYKVTNANEKHRGFQYIDGLNILKDKFDDNANHHQVPGGLYFTDINNIIYCLTYGVYLREITLPVDNPAFRVVKDGTNYRTNMLILGKKYNLNDVETIKILIEKGADIRMYNDYVLRWAASRGHLEIVKYLLGIGADIHATGDDQNSLALAASRGHLEMVKYLLKTGADIHADKDVALRKAVENNKFEVAKYLINSGAYIHADNDYALRYCVENGYLSMAKYLVEHGADVTVIDEITFRLTDNIQQAEIIKFLNEKKAEKNNPK